MLHQFDVIIAALFANAISSKNWILYFISEPKKTYRYISV